MCTSVTWPPTGRMVWHSTFFFIPSSKSTLKKLLISLPPYLQSSSKPERPIADFNFFFTWHQNSFLGHPCHKSFGPFRGIIRSWSCRNYFQSKKWDTGVRNKINGYSFKIISISQLLQSLGWFFVTYNIRLSDVNSANIVRKGKVKREALGTRLLAHTNCVLSVQMKCSFTILHDASLTTWKTPYRTHNW